VLPESTVINKCKLRAIKQNAGGDVGIIDITSAFELKSPKTVNTPDGKMTISKAKHSSVGERTFSLTNPMLSKLTITESSSLVYGVRVSEPGIEVPATVESTTTSVIETIQAPRLVASRPSKK